MIINMIIYILVTYLIRTGSNEYVEMPVQSGDAKEPLLILQSRSTLPVTIIIRLNRPRPCTILAYIRIVISFLL